MGTTLTGTTPQDTYDSLIKVTDNGPLSGTLKTLTDGLGNDSALALSTGAASITGTLAVTGATTITSSAVSLRLGNATSNSGANILIAGASTNKNWSIGVQQNVNAALEFTPTTTNGATTLGTTPAMVILDAGNVGIGTSSPESKLHIASSAAGSDVTLYVDNTATSTLNNSARLKFSADAGASVSGGGAELNCINVNAGNGAVDLIIKSWTGAAYTEKARFLAGGGLTFNGDTAAANALDDYEEGTFTATLTPSVSGSISLNPAACTYTKIGRQVTVKGFLGISSVSSPVGGTVDIGGLPFTIINSTAGRGTFSFVVLDASAGYNGFTGPTQHTANSTSIIAYYDASTLAASDEIMFTATYFV